MRRTIQARGVLGALLCLWMGPRAAATVTLDIPVFAGGYGIAFYEESARRFEQQRPDVRIRLYGDPRIADQLRIRLIDGNPPDAASVADILWPQLIRAHRLLDLGPFLGRDLNWEGDGKWGDSFLPGALDAWRQPDGTYGVPFSYSCWTIFYDRKFFRQHHLEEARTWEEFFQLGEKIRRYGRAPLSVPGVYLRYVDCFLRAAWCNLAGAEAWPAYRESAPGIYADPRFLRAVETWRRLAPLFAPGWEGMTHTSAQRELLEGRAAMNLSGSWMVSEMKGRFPDDFELGAMRLPVFPDGKGDPTLLQVGTDYFFVFATGDRVRERATVDFLRYLTSRERARAWVRTVDSPVAVRGVPPADFSERMRGTAALIATSTSAINTAADLSQPPAIRQALTDSRLRLMHGEITPRQFCERMEAAAEGERQRAARPGWVDYRHPVAGTILLAALAAFPLGYAVRAWRRRQGADRSAARPPEDAGGFGRLRLPVALGFVGPAFVLYAALVLVPGLAAFLWAFTRWDGINPRQWAGLYNFKWLLFESHTFWSALANNAFLMIVPALVVVPLALLLAACIHRGVRGAAFFRGVFLFPNLLGGVAATLLWLGAYEPHGGLVNATLVALGRGLDCDWLCSFDGYPWLAQDHLYWAMVPIYLWMACGFNLILYLAAMEGIDPQLYEAAEIDGASRARQFFLITLPMIWEILMVSAVFIVIAGLNAFEMIWLLTSQEPSTATHTLGTLLVSTMFKEFAVGRATAIAVMLFLLVLAASAGVMRGLRRETIEA
ncbi:MAG: transporter substrate-binding protein [Verrucomicrobia bacterium]|nr:transporter substrate-binding protein [Verrucomicrobiota bacterium]